MMVGRLLPYWEGNFSGAMFDFGKVNKKLHEVVIPNESQIPKTTYCNETKSSPPDNMSGAFSTSFREGTVTLNKTSNKTRQITSLHPPPRSTPPGTSLYPGSRTCGFSDKKNGWEISCPKSLTYHSENGSTGGGNTLLNEKFAQTFSHLSRKL